MATGIKAPFSVSITSEDYHLPNPAQSFLMPPLLLCLISRLHRKLHCQELDRITLSVFLLLSMRASVKSASFREAGNFFDNALCFAASFFHFKVSTVFPYLSLSLSLSLPLPLCKHLLTTYLDINTSLCNSKLTTNTLYYIKEINF